MPQAVGSWVRRHRGSVQDAMWMAMLLLLLAYIAFEVDVFVGEGTTSAQAQRLELNEVMLLGSALTLGMFVFATRRYFEQRRESRRRQEAERQARELAFQDGLTGLPNRRQFDEALNAALNAPPAASATHAVFLLDLNGFKQVNDIHGHAIGDEVLICVAHRLRAAMRDGDLVARFGGDEFAILARHLIGAEAATNVALRVIEALTPPVSTGVLRHSVGVGIGIALIPEDARTAQEALRKADIALYRAKAERRSALRFFEEGMDRQVRERDHLEQELRAALGGNAISCVYQPCVDLRTHEVLGFEAMPRWLHASGEIPAIRFIPIAEEAGLIHLLAERVLREACTAAKGWPGGITVSVDLHRGQLKDPMLQERILAVLKECGLSPQRLELEISESALVQDLEAAQKAVGALRTAGVRISLDNFGTGYSSLYHLRNFKLDKIKIDRSFIETMRAEGESAAIVDALVGLGQGLGLTVVAEGIHHHTQEISLLATGCAQGQGSLFSHALTAAAVAKLLR